MELGRDADFGLAELLQPRFVQASLLHDWQFATDRRTPDASVDPSCACASLSTYQWQRHCRGLYQTAIAA
jgi:hypothetical protein